VPIVYEKATVITSEILDSKWINQSEVIALNAVKRIIRSLAPKRPTEDANYVMTRHVAAINLLCYFDKCDVEWSGEMSEEISKVNGVESIAIYLEQSQHELYKQQAAQLVGMIAEEGSIMHLLSEQKAASILVECMLHRSINVKRSAAESLAFMIKDEATRDLLKDDRIMHVTLNEFSKRQD